MYAAVGADIHGTGKFHAPSSGADHNSYKAECVLMALPECKIQKADGAVSPVKLPSAGVSVCKTLLIAMCSSDDHLIRLLPAPLTPDRPAGRWFSPAAPPAL